MNKYLSRVVKVVYLSCEGHMGKVTSYLTQISLKNDSIWGKLLHYVDMIYASGSLKDYLGNLEEINHGRYLFYLLKNVFS